MSNEQQPEHMRPIPDGGLKDAMPSWLKRPPAWRNVPSAEERRERALPEPDTSEIDPRTLLEVSDLPQWLQTLAARGDVPVPEPDAAVVHAVAQLQAAAGRAQPAEVLESKPEQPATGEGDQRPTPVAEANESESPAEAFDSSKSVPTSVASTEASVSGRSSLFTGLLVTAGIIIFALILTILYLI